MAKQDWHAGETRLARVQKSLLAVGQLPGDTIRMVCAAPPVAKTRPRPQRLGIIVGKYRRSALPLARAAPHKKTSSRVVNAIEWRSPAAMPTTRVPRRDPTRRGADSKASVRERKRVETTRETDNVCAVERRYPTGNRLPSIHSVPECTVYAHAPCVHLAREGERGTVIGAALNLREGYG
eukprot:scaffold293861_cov28-Tisochrysis_lutea.AAC.11